MRRLATLVLLIACVPPPAQGDEAARAHYLSNAGVMIARGETKVLFDPLFRNDYGYYDLVPPDIERAIFDGSPPFDGVDAVFVSHSHQDHYDPELMARLLGSHAGLHLFAPAQAVAELRSAGLRDSERVHAIALAVGDDPVDIRIGELHVEAVRIPHSGWPERLTDVENIAYRVTLDDATTVVHLGDADADDAHFEKHAQHWEAGNPDLALPPYWFFLSPEGKAIVTNRIGAGHTIGVHVPTEMPDDASQRPAEFDGVDLFTKPGETRNIK